MVEVSMFISNGQKIQIQYKVATTIKILTIMSKTQMEKNTKDNVDNFTIKHIR